VAEEGAELHEAVFLEEVLAGHDVVGGEEDAGGFRLAPGWGSAVLRVNQPGQEAQDGETNMKVRIAIWSQRDEMTMRGEVGRPLRGLLGARMVNEPERRAWGRLRA